MSRRRSTNSPAPSTELARGPAAALANGHMTSVPTPDDAQIRMATRSRRPVSIGNSILRYPLLFLTIIVVCTAVGAGATLARTPTNTSEVRLLVGAVDAEAHAVPGFTQATQDLASIYARVVPTDVVLRPAAKAAGVSVATARGAISASPIPDSSIVRIEATSTDDATALRLAGAAGTALNRYVTKLNNVDPYSTKAYQDYSAAALQLAQAQVAQQALQERVDQLHTPGSLAQFTAGANLASDTAQAEAFLVVATSQALEAKVRADQLATAFQNRTRGLGDTTPVRVIAPAASQGSDRTQKLEMGVLLGLVAGVLLGLAVVLLRANWRYLRHLRHQARDRTGLEPSAA